MSVGWCCRRGPGVHEVRHLVSLMQTLLERGWLLPQALRTAWQQVHTTLIAAAAAAAAIACCSGWCLSKEQK